MPIRFDYLKMKFDFYSGFGTLNDHAKNEDGFFRYCDFSDNFGI